MYDETTSKANNQKEMQIKILYWSKSKNEICARHLQTFYIQHAKAEDLLDKLNAVIINYKLNNRNLISLSSDGPNVNKKVFRLLNMELISLRNSGLIDIGTCNLHVVNNAFLAGLQEFGESVADLAVAIKYFFKDKPSRQKDYEDCQTKLRIPHNRFIKHVASRWLTLEVAASRLLEQWPAILEYFLKYIPMKAEHIEKTNTYKTIKNILNKQTIKAEIMFVIESSKLFCNFSKKFQRSVPLVHILYDELKYLIICIMIRFCKPTVVEKVENNEYDNNIFDINNLIPLEEYESIIGSTIVSELKRNKKLSQGELKIFASNCRKHFKAVSIHILKKVPLFEDNNILKKLRCLNPKHMSQSAVDIVDIAKKIPGFTEFSQLESEWKLAVLKCKNVTLKNERIDHYWRQVFSCNSDVEGIYKYPNLQKVVEGVLCLSHGNAEVERGFSVSSKILTLERNCLNEKTLNSVLLVADSVKNMYDNKIETMTITSELYKLAKNAHAAYHSYQEEKKKEKEAAEAATMKRNEDEKRGQVMQEAEKAKKKKIREMEEDLKKLQVLESNKKKAATKILEEASGKLQKALSNNNIVEANIAQGLIDAANKMLKEEAELEKQKNALQSSVNKRKTDLLDYFSKKVCKKDKMGNT